MQLALEDVGRGYPLNTDWSKINVEEKSSHLDLKYLGAAGREVGWQFFVDRNNTLFNAETIVIQRLFDSSLIAPKECFRIYYNEMRHEVQTVTNTSFVYSYKKPIVRITYIDITKVRYIGTGT